MSLIDFLIECVDLLPSTYTFVLIQYVFKVNTFLVVIMFYQLSCLQDFNIANTKTSYYTKNPTKHFCLVF